MPQFLSAMRNLHIIEGYQDPVTGSTRLEMVLMGVWRVKTHPGKMKLPVTPLILHRICRAGMRNRMQECCGQPAAWPSFVS